MWPIAKTRVRDSSGSAAAHNAAGGGVDPTGGWFGFSLRRFRGGSGGRGSMGKTPRHLPASRGRSGTAGHGPRLGGRGESGTPFSQSLLAANGWAAALAEDDAARLMVEEAMRELGPSCLAERQRGLPGGPRECASDQPLWERPCTCLDAVHSRGRFDDRMLA